MDITAAGLWIVLAGCTAISATVFGLDGIGSDEKGIVVDVSSEIAPVSPYIYGQFIEHLGRCIYGGIWAEMLEDRKFFYPVDSTEPAWKPAKGKPPSEENGELPYMILVASPWKIQGEKQSVSMVQEGVWTGDHDVAISGGPSDRPNGIYQEGLALESGRKYVGRLVVRQLEGTPVLRVSLRENASAEPTQQAVYEGLSPDFAIY